MKLAIACDHGGYELKEKLKLALTKEGHQIVDCGTNSLDSCHYPLFAFKAAEMVQKGDCERGILICTSGEGVAISANKAKGIRCGVVYNEEVAHLIVEHNHANMMSIGAKYFDFNSAKKMVDSFLKAVPLGDRHKIRVDLIDDYDNKRG